jgi:hypothetical protein
MIYFMRGAGFASFQFRSERHQRAERAIRLFVDQMHDSIRGFKAHWIPARAACMQAASRPCGLSPGFMDNNLNESTAP